MAGAASTEIGSIHYDLSLDDSSFKKSLSGVSSGLKDFGRNLTDMGKSLTVGVTAPIVAGTTAALNFAKVAGQYESVKDSFRSMTKEMGIDVEDFQRRVAAATGNQIDNLTILQGATRGLSLIGKDAFNDFGSDFEKMAELSKKAARATGQDVNFMFDSLVLGISRESKLILDNLGISLDITKAKEEYAKSLGKTSQELTQSEAKHAVLNAALTQLEATYGDVAVSAGGFSGAWQELTTLLTNARIEIGNALAPALTDLVKQLTPLISNLVPKLVNLLTSLIERFNSLSPGMQEKIILAIALAAALGPVLVVLGTLITTLSTVITVLQAVGTALMFLAANPIGLLITVVALLALMIWKNWDQIKTATQILVNAVTSFFSTLSSWLSSTISKLVTGIVDWFRKMPSMIGGALSGLYDRLVTPFENAFNAIKRKAQEAIDKVKELNPLQRHSPSLVDNVTRGMNQIKREFESLANVQIPTASMLVAPEGFGVGGNTTQNININIDKINDQQDIRAIGRELGFRTGLDPRMFES